ncbi:MAG: TrkH family potassium uptake protein, partial [Anaerolineae bacterium]|nr:TrkH family potassium uptake protein [Anaerolineae bacterium]
YEAAHSDIGEKRFRRPDLGGQTCMKKQTRLIIFRLVGDVLYAFGFLLLVPLLVAIFAGEDRQAITFGIGAAICIPVFYVVRRRTSAAGVKNHHAAIALTIMWVSLSLISSIAFRLNGISWINALYEAFSGWTDTGLSMIAHPEELPVSLSLFRIMMQFVSGLGIVIFMLALRGPSSQAAQSLFQAEGRFEDFTTNIWHMGRTIFVIYSGYTLAGFLLLWALGVPPFDALMHAITSLSTGGFSTNSVGVGLYGALPSIVAIVLMLAGGISFSSHQALVTGSLKKFWRNPEVRALFTISIGASGVLFLVQYLAEGPAWDRVLASVFYAVTAISTCGAGTTISVSQLPDAAIFVIIILMLSGAAYGSTTGALKLWRLIIVRKVIGREIRRPFYPTGTVLPIRMGNNIITDNTALQVAAYVLLFVGIGLVGSLVFMVSGYRPLYALFTVFSAQGNVGLNAMPDTLYYGMHPLLKLQLIAHMLIGRIEIYPLLYLLHGLRE